MTDKQLPSYPLRMPWELREQLARVAKSNQRSMNAEIIARLAYSFDGFQRAGTEAASNGNGHGPMSGPAGLAGDETLAAVKRIEQQLQVLAQALVAEKQPDVSARKINKAVEKPVGQAARGGRPKR
ncbi:MAG: Arc family DNA-binding protein [Burkholderiaceae bacterium]|jgi:hypothetical protein|nr:Arc family DNA-binding protein [Burkholderiaceae bacterium]